MTFGGDGGYSAVDPTNANYLYGELQWGAVHRTTDGGEPGFPFPEFIAGNVGACPKADQFEVADVCNQTINFIPPMLMDPSNPERLLLGGQSLWRTNDARTVNTMTTGPTWSCIKSPAGSFNHISAIAIDDGNPDLVYVGHNNGQIYRSIDATVASPSWTQVNLPSMPARVVMDSPSTPRTRTSSTRCSAGSARTTCGDSRTGT